MERIKGKFFAVSVGPGDPELITLKAVRILEKTSVLAVPVNPANGTTALDIAAKTVDIKEKEIVRLETAMSMKKDVLDAAHARQLRQIIPYLDAGKDVAMPTLGDVSIYSTSLYLLRILEDMGYETEMISGVTSFCAAAAALNTSLTKMDGQVHIIPASSADLKGALSLEGTKILMKSGSKLPEVLEALEELNMTERAMIAADCGMENEQLYKDVRKIEELPGYYTIIIVRDEEK